MDSFLTFLQVKNVSGRFLVGLRWWHEVSDDGSSEWKFESLDEEGQKTVETFEKRLFWWTSYLYVSETLPPPSQYKQSVNGKGRDANRKA